MPAFQIELEWAIDSLGYDLHENPGRGLSIIGRGGGLRPTKPFSRFQGHYIRFASIKTPEDLLGFVRDYGQITAIAPLGSANYRSDSNGGMELIPGRDLVGEEVQPLLALAALFKKALGKKTKRAAALDLAAKTLGGDPIGELFVRYSKASKATMALRLSSLHDGLWMQLIQGLESEVRILTCRYCGRPFEAGTGTGRRADSLYCSREHQIEANSRARRKNSN
jgi:hypothetical protein